MTKLPGPRYIDTEAGLTDWVDRLRQVPVVAVDTESDSFHHYKEKVCLIQMTADSEDAILDPLALPSLDPLRSVFEDPRQTKIFHDAGYDLICLRRDFGFEVRGLFDTMLASRLLGQRSFGLATILRERFGHEANKRLQRSDWARRPLTCEQIEYARYDTHFLPNLREQLIDELRSSGRLAWAMEDFGRLPSLAARLTPKADRSDPDGFWRMRHLRGLSAVSLGRVRALYMMREQMAAQLDRPPFKVFSDNVLLDLAQDPPQTMADLLPRPGLRRGGIERFGKEILRALRKAKEVRGSRPASVRPRRRTGRFLDPEARSRYETLRQVRREKAEAVGLDPEVLLSNAVLEEMARQPPARSQDLSVFPELQGWREPILAEALLCSVQSAVVG